MVTQIVKHLGLLQVLLAGLFCINHSNSRFHAAAAVGSYAVPPSRPFRVVSFIDLLS